MRIVAIVILGFPGLLLSLGCVESRFELSNETPESCGVALIKVSDHAQTDAVALSGFEPPLTDGEAHIDQFTFLRTYEGAECGTSPTEVIAFTGTSPHPLEIPLDTHGTPALNTSDRTIIVTLDPPMRVTEERPYAFLGVRLEDSVCVMACPRASGEDANWRSSYPLSPFSWQPAPESGYVFSIAGF